MRFYRKLKMLERELIALEYDTSAEAKKRRERIKSYLFRLQLGICHIKDVDCRLVLIKRFIEKKKWAKVAEEMNYSVTQIYRIRARALLDFVPIMDNLEDIDSMLD